MHPLTSLHWLAVAYLPEWLRPHHEAVHSLTTIGGCQAPYSTTECLTEARMALRKRP